MESLDINRNMELPAKMMLTDTFNIYRYTDDFCFMLAKEGK